MRTCQSRQEAVVSPVAQLLSVQRIKGMYGLLLVKKTATVKLKFEDVVVVEIQFRSFLNRTRPNGPRQITDQVGALPTVQSRPQNSQKSGIFGQIEIFTFFLNHF